MRWLGLGFWIVVTQLAGALGALATDPALYRALERPSWAPPGWVFGPVWLTLYTMIGVAAWLIWQRPPSPTRTTALRAYWVQLALNAAWTPVFFGLEAPGAALIVIVVLWVAIVIAIRAFARVSRVAGRLLVPYLAWVSFATLLNAAIVGLARVR